MDIEEIPIKEKRTVGESDERNSKYEQAHKSSENKTCRVFQCEVCSKKFPTRPRLKRHSAIHSEEKPHKCDHCPNSYKTIAQLYGHEATVHDIGGDFSCDACGRTFPCSRRLEHHLASHSNNKKKFVCDLCDRSYKRQSQLIVHQCSRHATGENPHECDQCAEVFNTPYRLTSHKILAHDAGNSCKICGIWFITRRDLDKHSGKHRYEGNLECDHCDKKYKYRRDLVKHTRKWHATAETIENAKRTDMDCEVKVEPTVVYDSETRRELSYEELDKLFVDVNVKKEPEDIKESCDN